MFALIFLMVSQLLPGTIMTIYSNEADVISKEISYLRIVSHLFIFQGLSMTTIILFRAVGTVNVSFFTSLASFYVNVFFNYVLIFGSLCAPVLRIQASAIAILSARIIVIFTKLEDEVTMRSTVSG